MEFMHGNALDSLMTFDVSKSDRQYVQQFINRIDLRNYANGRKLSFYDGTLLEAFNTAMSDNKLLAIYLHADNDCGRSNFPTHILHQEEIRRTLEDDFVMFPWDCTTCKGRNKIQETLNEFLCKDKRHWIDPTRLPYLLLIGLDSNLDTSTYDQIGYSNPSLFLDRLRANINQFTRQKNNDGKFFYYM